ncbi:cytochrome P450, partial [Pholiota conissans]
NDFFVNLAEAAVAGLGHAVLPGAALMNVFPVLRFIPSWFPGAGFKRVALECRQLVLQMRDVPLAWVEARLKEGKMPNCIAVDLLENCQSKEHYAHIAGTASSLGTFFLAMAMFPEFQAKAKKEIDVMIGTHRLVNFEDKESLPYIEALRREVMRWRPVFPLGVTRAASSDDIYNGCYIPEGATVMYNTWAVAHDPRRYPDPDAFNPDRFFNENGELNNDEVDFPFGYGRRMCPGRHFASATIWLAIATVLQNFDIEKTRDSAGDEIPITGQYGDGFLRHPLPFECAITPRSKEATQVILNAMEHT